MENQKIWKIIGAVVIVLVLALVLIFSVKPKQLAPEPLDQLTLQTMPVTVTIEGWYTAKLVSLPAGSTVLQLLQLLNTEDEELQLLTEEYEGLGVLVTSLAGQTNGADNKYWQYKVNGVVPQVGASALVLTAGDQVEWKFQESEF